jgi:hypothetical protein
MVLFAADISLCCTAQCKTGKRTVHLCEHHVALDVVGALLYGERITEVCSGSTQGTHGDDDERSRGGKGRYTCSISTVRWLSRTYMHTGSTLKEM